MYQNKSDFSNPQQVTRPTTMSIQIFNIIKNQIMRDELPAGTVLTARELADQLNTSVTPVREALILLEHSGWIEQRSKNKVVVFPTAQELREYADVRLYLELLSFHLTKNRICPEWIAEMRAILNEAAEYNYQQDGINYSFTSSRFHLYLCEKSGNKYLYNMLSELLDRSFLVNIMRNKKNNQMRITTIENHEKLVHLLETSRWNEYEAELARHIQLWEEHSVVATESLGQFPTKSEALSRWENP